MCEIQLPSRQNYISYILYSHFFYLEVEKGALELSLGKDCVCHVMTKAAFLEDEPGLDVPDGDTPNFLKFPKVFLSLFWPFPCFDH